MDTSCAPVTAVDDDDVAVLLVIMVMEDDGGAEDTADDADGCDIIFGCKLRK